MLHLGQIVPNLYVGSCLSSTDEIDDLTAIPITAVLNLLGVSTEAQVSHVAPRRPPSGLPPTCPGGSGLALGRPAPHRIRAPAALAAW